MPPLSSETLDTHKLPENGERPVKLGVVPESHPVGAPIERHSLGDAPTNMDGVSVEVRGSNGAFYKVTVLKTRMQKQKHTACSIRPG